MRFCKLFESISLISSTIFSIGNNMNFRMRIDMDKNKIKIRILENTILSFKFN